MYSIFLAALPTSDRSTNQLLTSSPGSQASTRLAREVLNRPRTCRACAATFQAVHCRREPVMVFNRLHVHRLHPVSGIALQARRQPGCVYPTHTRHTALISDGCSGALDRERSTTALGLQPFA